MPRRTRSSAHAIVVVAIMSVPAVPARQTQRRCQADLNAWRASPEL